MRDLSTTIGAWAARAGALLADWLAHVLLAFVMMAALGGGLALAGIAEGHWFGALFAIGNYYGREVRDHEIKLGRPSTDTWHISWMPWRWNKDGVTDFLAPLLAVLVLATAIEWLT